MNIYTDAFRSSQTIEETLLPGQVRGLDVPGDSFFVLKLPSKLSIKVDQRSAKDFYVKQGERFVSPFKRVELENKEAFSQSFILWVGFGEFLDKTFTFENAPTKLVGYSSSTIAANTTLMFSGNISDSRNRKTIFITNNDPTSSLEILDENNNLCALVFPKNTYYLDVSGIVKVKNSTGSAISFAVSEAFYSR